VFSPQGESQSVSLPMGNALISPPLQTNEQTLVAKYLYSISSTNMQQNNFVLYLSQRQVD
jgi:hypothetical protein